MNRSVTVFAPAKINLTLDIFPPRADGYHDLDSIVLPVTPCDTLTVAHQNLSSLPPLPTNREREGEGNLSSFSLTCNDPNLPTDSTNLVVKAWQVTKTRFPDLPPLSAHLEKRLPMQAGLGGGSSDAAALLRALVLLFDLPISAMFPLAAAVGSDVPLFLHDGPVRMQGRGNIVTPLPFSLSPLHGVLVKPNVGVPTGPAYALLDAVPDRQPGRSTENLLTILESAHSVQKMGSALHNDFEAVILPAYPAVRAVHAAVVRAGAIKALLCGSGAAVFGLAENETQAQEIAFALYRESLDIRRFISFQEVTRSFIALKDGFTR